MILITIITYASVLNTPNEDTQAHRSGVGLAGFQTLLIKNGAVNIMNGQTGESLNMHMLQKICKT